MSCKNELVGCENLKGEIKWINQKDLIKRKVQYMKTTIKVSENCKVP
jgi:hypothetical protein